MIIHSHAITQYIERVLNIERSQASDSVVQFAREQIEDAAQNPDQTYNGKKSMSPIHIKNGCAVPVVDNGELRVPTAYHETVFIRKMEDNE